MGQGMQAGAWAGSSDPVQHLWFAPGMLECSAVAQWLCYK